ncbi:MAG: hypothetical protein HQM10_03755 [Candidatus Riflebacteria bacterium]|nr:hypothetical protein [Candidatus Riflebacteria bacterium]
MSLDEIHVNGSSISFSCLVSKTDSVEDLFKAMMDKDQQFSLDPERAGFHDCESDGETVRGFFSVVVPFEVERLNDGIMSKFLLKRIETCEFILLKDMTFAFGKSSAQKNLSLVLTMLTNFGVTPVEYEFHNMSQFQDRLSVVKSIVLTNPKTREISKARLAGRIEDYTDYGIVEPKNHEIDSVSGLVDSPLGPLNVNLSSKGNLRISVKKGFVLTVNCLKWIIRLTKDSSRESVQDDSEPTEDEEDEEDEDISEDRLHETIKKAAKTLKKASGRSGMTLITPTDSIKIKDPDEIKHD